MVDLHAPEGSIVARHSARPTLLAFEVKDKITKPDIEWMATVVDQAIDAYDTIDIILVMTNYDGAELSAVFDGDALAVQARSASHVRRYAVVGAPGWARAMITMMDPITPVDARTFDLADEAAAWRWVEATEPA